MALSEAELLEIEIASAWEAFCDGDPNMSTEEIKKREPAFYRLLALSFSNGFVAGAKSVMRSVKK